MKTIDDYIVVRHPDGYVVIYDTENSDKITIPIQIYEDLLSKLARS